jgi:AraC-like DNA-binding protein
MNPHGFQKPTVSARISLSGTRAAYVGPGLELAPHRNAVATLAVALQSPFELEFLDHHAQNTMKSSWNIALIPPGTLHYLRASGDMAFIYLDALSDDCVLLAKIDLTVAHARLTQHPETIRSLDVDTLCRLLGVPAAEVKDARIAEVIRSIDKCPQDFVRITDAANMAGLSASRFQELFRQSVGVPFRRYRLWRRMSVVVRELSAGESLTEAAFNAGFSSSAHLSSTFKAMFGLTPSRLARLHIPVTGKSLIRSEVEHD